MMFSIAIPLKYKEFVYITRATRSHTLCVWVLTSCAQYLEKTDIKELKALTLFGMKEKKVHFSTVIYKTRSLHRRSTKQMYWYIYNWRRTLTFIPHYMKFVYIVLLYMYLTPVAIKMASSISQMPFVSETVPVVMRNTSTPLLCIDTDFVWIIIH